MNNLPGYLLLYSSKAPGAFFWQGPGVKMNDRLDLEIKMPFKDRTRNIELLVNKIF